MLRRVALFVLLIVGLLLPGCSGGATPLSSSGPAASPSSSTGCGSDAVAPSSTTTVTVEVAGSSRTARLHVPDGYEPATPTPVILAFVGHGMSTTALESFSGLDRSDALVLYPEPAGSNSRDGWESAPYASGQDDVAFVSALLDHAAAAFCVDAKRVFAVGISNGGGLVSLLSCRLAERIAAFATVSAAVYPSFDPPCPAVAGVPLVDFHGTADPVIPYDGGSSHGAALEPVPQWLDEQARRSGCVSAPSVSPIGSDVQEQQWSGCSGRGVLVHYRIEGGGHTWPGATGASGPGSTTGTISASQIVQDFFASHAFP